MHFIYFCYFSVTFVCLFTYFSNCPPIFPRMLLLYQYAARIKASLIDRLVIFYCLNITIFCILGDDQRDTRFRRQSYLTPPSSSSPKLEFKMSRSVDMRSTNHQSNVLRAVTKAPPALLRILIVDDSPSILKVVCQMLKQKGTFHLLAISILFHFVLCNEP